jgi:hypothetical protein
VVAGEGHGRSAAAPRRRVAVLGASNVYQCLPTVVRTSCSLLGGPVEMFLAAGFGRSFGAESWVLGRALPGISACGIWEALAARPRLATSLLVTDVGNDILYGYSVDGIARWVETCLARLQGAEQIVITEVPLASLRKLGAARYLLLRTINFPQSRVDLPTALASAEELNGRLVELARRFGARLVRPPGEWYGFDPIHILPWRWKEAWEHILASWRQEGAPPRSFSFRPRPVYLWTRRPQRRRVFFWEQHARQPAASLADGTTLWMY